MSGSNNQRRRRRLVITWVASFALVIAFYLVMWERPLGLNMPPLVSVGLGLLVLASMLALHLYYWRTLDELARAIQTNAFFWSGLTTWGLLLALVVIEPVLQIDSAVLAEIGALGGAMLIVFTHTLLYLALWGWAWLKRR